MSRTRKKCPWEWNSVFRTPRGKRQALRGKARKRAIPPDGWDDKNYDSQCWIPQRVAEAMLKKGMNPHKVVRHLAGKYGISYRTSREIVEFGLIGSWRWWPEGCVKVYDEQAVEG